MREMSDGLAMFNPEGRLVFCNDQYRAAFPRSAYARQPGAHITDPVRAVVRNAEGPDQRRLCRFVKPECNSRCK
ncbi:PAS-domain containing protein [Pararhizobium sp. A13]|uniref:PAS-domain containing protein n=1 Tax=Pararhizobium sp. A13 TaxID=3133975 RepID=UPI00311B0119